MDDRWIISWFNHIAFDDANPIWKSPGKAHTARMGPDGPT